MPERTRRAALAVGAGALGVLVLAAFLYDYARRDLIAKGVRIDGVDVGGLHGGAARAKIQRALVARLEAPVVVHRGSRSWTLPPRDAGLTVESIHFTEAELKDYVKAASAAEKPAPPPPKKAKAVRKTKARRKG